MNLLLEINPNESLSFWDALGYGGQTVLLGMATIFAVLIIIWIALALMKNLLHGVSSKKADEPTVTAEPVTPPPVVRVSADDEIVAVIAAAIAMAESESNGARFRVVSFRRK